MARSSEESTKTDACGLPATTSALSQALGTRFRVLREERGWSQRELGSRLGIHQSKLSKYESGTHQPSLRTLVRIANIFAVTTDYLLTGAQVQPPPLRDERLLDRFRQLGAAGDELRTIVLSILDAILELDAHAHDRGTGSLPVGGSAPPAPRSRRGGAPGRRRGRQTP